MVTFVIRTLIIKDLFMKLKFLGVLVLLAVLAACGEDEPNNDVENPGGAFDLTIFFVNDPHGRIDNFAKIKTIVDRARAQGEVLVVTAGDLFAGNPIVDQAAEPGFPIIDIMNQVGFDVGVLGNHEFDFGTTILQDRVEQSDFPWILANIDASQSVLEQPDPFITLSAGGFDITFLGLIETRGKDREIPSTHPLRVADLSFQRHREVVNNYANLKAEEGSDLLIGLTHLGSRDDIFLANNSPFFDLIIGGHSHERISEEVNGIPVIQAGSNLRTLGRIDLTIENQEIADYRVRLIDLETVEDATPDEALAEVIATYNNDDSFSTVVGNSNIDHEFLDMGCFYTTALKEFMDVDFTIQNLGGIRAGFNEGPIATFEVFSMDPFNNQSVTFTKTVGEFENFFCGAGAEFFFTGITVASSSNDFQLVDDNGVPLADDMQLTLGVNDFIPALYDDFFDFAEADIKDYTTAEAVIGYLQSLNEDVDFGGCISVLECEAN